MNRSLDILLKWKSAFSGIIRGGGEVVVTEATSNVHQMPGSRPVVAVVPWLLLDWRGSLWHLGEELVRNCAK